MSTAHLYLKPNVLAEPLFNQWYASPALLFPATAAMYVANAHVKTMKSFVSNPQLHVEALKDPAMLGSNYLHHEARRAPEVAQLLERTLREQAPLLELAEAIRGLDTLLATKADGHSLEPLYREVPPALRGFVELLYDLNNQPSFRFIEPLLYRSRFYNPASQSVLLTLAEDDHSRAFVFSTPRLFGPEERERSVQVKRPFHHEALDALFRMRTEPGPVEAVRERLGIPTDEAERFARLFTPEPPAPAEPRPEGVRVRYFGHACLLVESRETSVLFDPVIPYKHGQGPERFGFEELPPRVDYVVITHAHLDHAVLESLLPLRHRIGTVVVPRSVGGTLLDPSLRLILQQCGFRNVVELGELESLPLPSDGTLTAIPFLGEHADLAIATKSAYVVELEGRRIMAIADSNAFEPEVYAHVHALVGDMDVLFVGMECEGAPLTWIAGPLMTRKVTRKMDQSRRFSGSNSTTALAMVERFRPKQVYVYAMGQEPWLTFLTSIRYTPQSYPIVESDKLVATCRERGIAAERLFGCKDIPVAPAAR